MAASTLDCRHHQCDRRSGPKHTEVCGRLPSGRSARCADSGSEGRAGCLLGALVGGVLAAGAAATIAAIPDSNGVIHGCYQKNVGNLRVIDPSGGDNCRPSEIPISWSQTGPQGRKGDTGATGATGPQGLKGDTGATGATGAGVEGRYGCDRRDGGAGVEGRHGCDRRDRAAGVEGRHRCDRPGRSDRAAGASWPRPEVCRLPIRRARRTPRSRVSTRPRTSSAVT